MPSSPRGKIVAAGEVAVYHCWNRCAQQAFLFGVDPVTGVDFDYRRQWIGELEELLAGLFGIEIAFHVEMGNHLHLEIRTRPDVVENWEDEEVVRRWLVVSQLAKSLTGQPKEPHQARIAMEMAIPGRCDVLRERLSNISWFMATLGEAIARRCNHEVGGHGHFWEERFQCRQLLDEAAILVCGMYIDLNQIRAGETQTPESSTHTSAYDRIESRQQRLASDDVVDTTGVPETTFARDGWLCELTLDPHMKLDDPRMVSSATQRRASDKGLLPMTLDEYLSLLDASGRVVRSDKTGAIPTHLEPILERLGIRPSMWTDLITNFHERFGHVVGSAQRVAERAVETGRKWFGGSHYCAAAFS